MLAPFFGLFTSFILFYYRKDFNRSNLYLALFYLCSNLIVLVYFGLHFSKTPFWEGVFFVQFMPLSFVIGPLLFFYVKYAVAENKNIRPIRVIKGVSVSSRALTCNQGRIRVIKGTHMQSRALKRDRTSLSPTTWMVQSRALKRDRTSLSPTTWMVPSPSSRT